MLWASKESFAETEIDGNNYVTFTPKQLLMQCPLGSDLAKEITRNDFGIVFHRI